MAVSTEEFDEALIELLGEMSPEELLAIPGLYVVVSEHLNNDAIEHAEEKKQNEG